MIVVDTSVAIKWLIADEEGHNEAMALYKNHIERIEEIFVPGLFYIEAANALATNSAFSEDDIAEGMEFLLTAHFKEQQITPKMIIEAALLAKKYKTSVYDMLYAVIAKSHNATLITADKRFARAVNLPYVRLLAE